MKKADRSRVQQILHFDLWQNKPSLQNTRGHFGLQ